jgi:hypothetical protein
MHKQRIYIDTSVIGGCFDEPFEEWSNKYNSVNLMFGFKTIEIRSPKEVVDNG